jgi:gliding motility-associated-like protein
MQKKSIKTSRIFCLLIILFSAPGNYILSQNLVPNWSFEKYSACPNGYTQITNAIGWYPSYVDNCCGYQVEYLNACGTPGFQVPSNVWGNHTASTGQAYMAQVTMAPTVTTNYRENIYTKLISPLVPGETYYVSMKVVSATDCENTTNNDGIKFSTNSFFSVNNIAAVHSTVVITDQVNWTTISGCYMADSAYTYIGVGNFFDDAHTTMSYSCSSCSNVYPGYYVDDISVIPMTITASRFSICKGDSSILTASGGTSYLWSNGNTNSSIIVKPTINATYSVSITNPYCTLDTSITIIIGNSGIITGNDSVCNGSAIFLTASPGTAYLWNTGATTSSLQINHAITADSLYYVIISNGSCVDTVYKKIVISQPSAINACCNTTITNGESVQLNASGASNYVWTPSTGLSCTNCQNPIATPLITTTYTVSTLNANTCVLPDTVIVSIETLCADYNVPNIFTPNGDGVNDYFAINTQALDVYKISIYDRWGVLQYESTSPSISWNGHNSSGEEASTGVYYYIIRSSCNGKEYDKHGYLELIR